MRKSLKNIFLLIVLMIHSIVLQAQWTQIGGDINATNNVHMFGRAVSLNAYGDIVAIGAPEGDIMNGYAEIYQYMNESWQQIGNTFIGENNSDWLGRSISLDSIGHIVAFGIMGYDGAGVNRGMVKVFEYDAGEWIQLGDDINGEVDHELTGSSVALNSDGTIIAIGAEEYSYGGFEFFGKVRIFEYDGENWQQIGNTIVGENDWDYFGSSVYLNSSGTIAAIGAMNGETSELFRPGYIKVYEFINDEWVQKGTVIEGDETGEGFGLDVSISADGLKLISGSPGNDEGGPLYGNIRVFEYIINDWQQKGSTIYGDYENAVFGTNVDINADGTIIAGSSINSIDLMNIYPYVKIYSFESGDWVQNGNAIISEQWNDQWGTSVCLNDSGTVVAAGAPQHDISQTVSGHVKIYTSTDFIGIKAEHINIIRISPNPSTGIICVETDEDPEIIKVYDLYGRCIFETTQKQIDLTDYAKGTYIIKLHTKSRMFTEKLILQ